MARRTRKMSYWIYFKDSGHSFRNNRGHLHRDFTLDDTSMGSIVRDNQRQAFRCAQSLANRYGVDVVTEQLEYRYRHKYGETARWFCKSWITWPFGFSAAGQAPKEISSEVIS